MKKKKKLFFCVCIPPRKEDRGRPRYYLIKALSFKTALKLYALKILKVKKKVYKKKNIKEGYYYYDGTIYIEKLAKIGKNVLSTGYFHEICRSCLAYSESSKNKKKKRNKKKRGKNE